MKRKTRKVLENLIVTTIKRLGEVVNDIPEGCKYCGSKRIVRYGHYQNVQRWWCNDSKFKVIRHGNSRFFDYKEETLAGETITEIHRALLELGIVLLPHEPGNARAKGKIERVFRFIQERFISEHTAIRLGGWTPSFRGGLTGIIPIM